jgi:hypothetical protein
VPAKKGPEVGIKLLLDDLVEKRERKQVAYERCITKLIETEDRKRKKMLHERSAASRERTSRRQQDVMELAHRSGQLTAQSRLSTSHSIMRMRNREAVGPDKEEEEALAALTKYDDELWNKAQLARKTDPVSQLLSENLSVAVSRDPSFQSFKL